MSNNINHRRRSAGRNKKKKIILFSSIVLVVVVAGMLSAKYMHSKSINADASELSNNNEVVTENKSEGTPVEENKLDNSGYLTAEEDPNADSAAFVEKYLYEQSIGKMPEGANGHKVAYLTFDDGPSESVTPEVLKVLKDKDAKATFFTLGKSINESDRTKELLKEIVKDGHAVASHTYSHDYHYLYPNRIVSIENFMSDIEKNNETFRQVLGKDFVTKTIRFPGGLMSWKGQDTIKEKLKEGGYSYIEWNALSKDAEGKTKVASELLEEVKKSVAGREKAVILMHDAAGKQETAKALPQVIDYLREQGYELKSIK
ncbi:MULTISPECIES: polysaccharide deacetylase family protein [Clostridium]|uniref:Polysaccharide deacetylase family protein n=1 Tax=Clostridium aquiflavi TaxID=3073603 RepID=A0ABU1EHA7_9CLOT|nr:MULTISPECIES: polysaccharide deacetylase family protein [unclassified Clostridium]MDR5587766.1 polysaccharide deacetylase family protein [Clostridium sp. 5N-1]NFG62402.1 polysaccharide deacetylase [Clostridium botulinum]NFQ09080.1 polysaccharide deacetylase [Clostridium botulinum]